MTITALLLVYLLSLLSFFAGALRPYYNIKTTGYSRSHLGGFTVDAEGLQIESDNTTEGSLYFDLKERTRRWFLLNHQKRPEVFISTLEKSSGGPSLHSEIWKSVLLSVRVLQKDLAMPNYVSVHVYPNLNEYNVEYLAQVASSVENALRESSPIFQPNFERKISVYDMPSSVEGKNKNVLVISVATKRTSPDVAELDDLESYVPQAGDIIDSSEIENFPFPTVFDFISEINRPPDAFILNEV